MITFVIPSIGRTTLNRALNSLINQTERNWKCIVGFDGIRENELKFELLKDERIQYLFLDKSGYLNPHGNGQAGQVRNKIIKEVDTEWIAFLDDDDTLNMNYISLFNEEVINKKFDCCLFRMFLNNQITPPLYINHIVQNMVGISFCVKREFIETKQIKFENNNTEDFYYLNNIQNNGGNIYISNYITYNVGF
jgi:glycosyltransferase involved in cell wall biosynthesis